MNEQKVEIGLEEYVQLRQESETLQNILKIIMEKASLNYDSTRLNYCNGDELINYLRIAEETIYNDTLTELQQKEKGDKND